MQGRRAPDLPLCTGTRMQTHAWLRPASRFAHPPVRPQGPHFLCQGSREQKDSPQESWCPGDQFITLRSGALGPSLLGLLVSQRLYPLPTQAAPRLFLLTKELRLSFVLSDLLRPGKQGW